MSAPALMESSPSWRLVSLVITMMGTVVVRVWILKRRVNSRPVMEPVQCPSVMTMSVGPVIAIWYATTVVAALIRRYPDARNARAYAALSSTELLTNRIDGVRRARIAIHSVPFPQGYRSIEAFLRSRADFAGSLFAEPLFHGLRRHAY